MSLPAEFVDLYHHGRFYRRLQGFPPSCEVRCVQGSPLQKKVPREGALRGLQSYIGVLRCLEARGLVATGTRDERGTFVRAVQAIYCVL
jgi:hypothetical protein